MMSIEKVVLSIIGFFKRIFTGEKFPERTKGRFDKTVGEVYRIRTMKSKEQGKMLLAMEPKEEYQSEIDESELKNQEE